jgi:MFS family permease
MTGPAPSSLWSVLARNRDFRLFWAGNLVSSAGVWMQNLAQGWLLLELTDSPWLLGVAGFALLSPTLALSLVGGAVADRADRRRILIATQTTLMLLALALGALTSVHLITAPIVLGIVFLNGVAVALNSPAYQAAIADLVPAADLSRALALNSIQFNVARVAGHALAGVLVVRIGAAGCFYINASTYVVMLYALWHVRLASRHIVRDAAPFWTRVREGIGYAKGNRTARNLIATTATMSLLGLPYFILLPAFSRDVLGEDAGRLGYLMASVSAGALAGGLVAARIGERFGKERTIAAGALTFWIALLAFSGSRHYVLSVCLLMAVGFALVSTVVTVNNVLQVATAPGMRGRIMSIYTMALNGLAPIGSLLAGALAERFSTAMAVGGMAVAGLAVALVLTIKLLKRPESALQFS